MDNKEIKHWSKVEYLHETNKNKNIIIKGTKSYYSNAYTENFENYVVRYLYGDEYSTKAFKPLWEYDKLYIGNYVCIGAETIILMGGNNTHRNDWFSNYPFSNKIKEAYKSKGATIIKDGVWIGMRSTIMPGITIGEGAVIGANSVITRDVPAYTIVAGNPAKEIRKRFDTETIQKLIELKIYDLPEDKIEEITNELCNNDINKLIKAINKIRTT